MDTIRKTPLYDVHKKLNGNIIDFHGVYLPVFYTSIQEEHNAVRTNIGIFDVSHMGNVILTFPDKETAHKKLNYLLPNNYSKIFPGKIIYSTLLNTNGTVIDDLLVMCITDCEYHIVINSANIDKDYEWIRKNLENNNTIVTNLSNELAIIALQGRNASKFLTELFGFKVSSMKSFEVIKSVYNYKELVISRTGYTGEDGFELIIENDSGVKLFEELLEKGKKDGLIPCGLGARDTLRLEAGLPLYGQELDENHSPTQSMISWSVKLYKDRDFIGKKAIIENENGRFNDIMIGFEVEGRSIPRTGMEILNENDEKIGYVTSGSFSPTLKKNIGIAYINKDYEKATNLKIQIRNKIDKIVKLEIPFYKKIINRYLYLTRIHHFFH